MGRLCMGNKRKSPKRKIKNGFKKLGKPLSQIEKDNILKNAIDKYKMFLPFKLQDYSCFACNHKGWIPIFRTSGFYCPKCHAGLRIFL